MRMFTRIKQLLDKREGNAGREEKTFAAPVFENDEEKTRTANLLNVVLITLLVSTVVGTMAMYWIEPT